MMDKLPWILLGLILAPFAGWVWLAVADWRANRRRERQMQGWHRRNQ